MLATLVGFFASARLPGFLLNSMIRKYCRFYKVSPGEFDLSPGKIRCFDDFFTRDLVPGARTVEKGIVSPVDAEIYACGKVDNGQILQVKGQEISTTDLLNEEINGDCAFVSMYLSPADYHKYHAPADLEILTITHVPGMFFSVRPKIAGKRKVFLKNERVVLKCRTTAGKLWLVLIAAQNVGKIGLCALEGKAPKSKYASEIPFNGKSKYKKGEELGAFHMGSSVVLIAENASLSCHSETKILMGQSIGTF